MSNGLDITEVSVGIIQPGEILTIFYWAGEYNKVRKKARFFTVVPDPFVDIGTGVVFVEPSQTDMELTRSWATVWLDENGNPTFQRNATFTNSSDQTATYHLLLAETDN
jgi:hypothetical protein